MLEFIKEKRTHYATNLTRFDAGEKVVLMGWVHRRRDLGGLIFIDLRDVSGLIQVVFKPEKKELIAMAHKLRNEYVFAVSGKVVLRENINRDLLTGEIEVEAELTIKALERGYRIMEIPINLRPRPKGSHSKIHILRDGLKILLTILALFRDYKPLTFFGVLGLGLIILGFIPGLIVIYEYMTTGLVLRFPSAILAIGLVLSGMLLIVIGLILHTVNRRFQEMEYFMRLLIKQSDKRSV